MVQIGGTLAPSDRPTYLNQNHVDLALCEPFWFRFGGTGQPCSLARTTTSELLNAGTTFAVVVETKAWNYSFAVRRSIASTMFRR